jgi:Protein of unknown function (DUF1822)
MCSELFESTDWILEIPVDRQQNIWRQSRTFPTTWGRWNAYFNQLCLETCLHWLQAEYLPTATADMQPALWGLVNGSIVTVGKLRIALIPTEAIDRSQLVVPQEWVDIPSWAADYYLGVQIAPDCGSLAIYGYTTHQQLKTQASYDRSERNYCLDTDDLIWDLNALWLSYERYTIKQIRAPLAAVPALESVQAERLIERLGNPELVMPRLAVPFPLWGALLADPRWQQQLSQQWQGGNSSTVFTRLRGWFVPIDLAGLTGQIDEVWQSIELVLLPQQIAVRSPASPNPLKIAAGDVCRAKVFDLDGGQIALSIGISPVTETESRISVQVYPVSREMYLPSETQLRLLSTDGSEIGKVNAAVTEMIQLQFRVSAGEQFEIEIACCGQILRERFEA